jgi:hypothetical protein
MELSSGMSWLCVSREKTSLPFCSPLALKEICFVYFLGRLECVSPPFSNVSQPLVIFLRDVWIWIQSAVANGLAPNLATHLSNL